VSLARAAGIGRRRNSANMTPNDREPVGMTFYFPARNYPYPLGIDGPPTNT